jgi:hypothetical protein
MILIWLLWINNSPREAAVAIVQHVNARDQHVAILALNVLSLYFSMD